MVPGRNDVVEALGISLALVVIDEDFDLVFEIARQVIVPHKESVVQHLTPTLDLALDLWMMKSVADIIDF